MPNLPAASASPKLPNLGFLLRGPAVNSGSGVPVGYESVIHGTIFEAHHATMMPTVGAGGPGGQGSAGATIQLGPLQSLVSQVRAWNTANPTQLQFIRVRCETGINSASWLLNATATVGYPQGPINFTTTGAQPKSGQAPVWWDPVVIAAYQDWITKLGAYIDSVPEILMVAPGLAMMYSAEIFIRWPLTGGASLSTIGLTTAIDLATIKTQQDIHAAAHPNTWMLLDVNGYQNVDSSAPQKLVATQQIMDYTIAGNPLTAFTNASMDATGNTQLYTVMQGYGKLGNNTAPIGCQTLQPSQLTGTHHDVYLRAINYGMCWIELPDTTDAAGTSANTTSQVAPGGGVYLYPFDQLLQANAPPAPSVPAAPTNLAIAPGNAQAIATWSAPASNGSAIYDYTLQYRMTAGPGAWTSFSHTPSPAPSMTVTGLSIGTSYDFRVRAINSLGVGAWSALVTSVLPNVPGAPSGVSAIAGHAAATVYWTAPASNGGTAILSYTVTTTGTGAPAATTGISPTATSAVISGLTNGNAYTFTVAAVNAQGTGTGATSGSVTPTAGNTAPGAPTGVSGTSGNAQAAVSWTAPASNGGSAITDYTVQQSTNGGATWTTSSRTPASPSTATTVTVTGLTNGTAYIFQVAAVNAIGAGPYSAVSASVTPATVPGAPTGVVGQGFTDGSGEATISWTAPGNGGSPLTSYTVTPSLVPGVMQGLTDQAGQPVSGWDGTGAVQNQVCKVYWQDIQPTAYGALTHTTGPNGTSMATIDAAITWAKAGTNRGVKIRVFTGIYAPSGVTSINDPSNPTLMSGQPAAPYTIEPSTGNPFGGDGVMGAFWTDSYRAAYNDLMTKLAAYVPTTGTGTAALDLEPTIKDIALSGTGMIFMEPTWRFMQDTAGPSGISSLNAVRMIRAGFTATKDIAAMKRYIDDAAVAWPNTALSHSFNVYSNVDQVFGPLSVTASTTAGVISFSSPPNLSGVITGGGALGTVAFFYRYEGRVTTDPQNTSKIIDTNSNFVTAGVVAGSVGTGDIVEIGGNYATVTSISTTTNTNDTLNLSATLPTGDPMPNFTYFIWPAAVNSGATNLYAGWRVTAATSTTITISNTDPSARPTVTNGLAGCQCLIFHISSDPNSAGPHTAGSTTPLILMAYARSVLGFRGVLGNHELLAAGSDTFSTKVSGWNYADLVAMGPPLYWQIDSAFKDAGTYSGTSPTQTVAIGVGVSDGANYLELSGSYNNSDNGTYNTANVSGTGQITRTSGTWTANKFAQSNGAGGYCGYVVFDVSGNSYPLDNNTTTQLNLVSGTALLAADLGTGKAAHVYGWNYVSPTQAVTYTGQLASNSEGPLVPSAVTVTGAPPAVATTINGFSNGAQYTATVTAANAVGSGAASAPSPPFEPLLQPSAVPANPTNVAAVTNAPAQATVTWTPDPHANPSVTSSVIQPQTSTDGGTSWASQATVPVSGLVTTYTVTGLTNGTLYRFLVASVNSVGTSGYSAASNTVVPQALVAAPGAPAPPTFGAVTQTSVVVNWLPPTYLGIPPVIDSYTLLVLQNGQVVQTITGILGLTYTVTGLTPGTAYTFEVEAVNG